MANGRASRPDVAPPPPPPPTRPSVFSQRSLKQLGLFFAGAGFLAFSTIITRRAVVRRQIAAFPKFYQQSNRVPGKDEGSEGSLIALEALHLATLNVVGFGIMATGGAAWAFDISSVDDLRRMARRHIGAPGGPTDEAFEKDIEEWVAKVLARKDMKDVRLMQDKSVPSSSLSADKHKEQ